MLTDARDLQAQAKKALEAEVAAREQAERRLRDEIIALEEEIDARTARWKEAFLQKEKEIAQYKEVARLESEVCHKIIAAQKA